MFGKPVIEGQRYHVYGITELIRCPVPVIYFWNNRLVVKGCLRI